MFSISTSSRVIMEHEACLHDGKSPPAKISAGPDGLEAWLVALAACFINFVMAGLGRMSGELFVALIEIFDTDRGQASLPFSLRSSMRNLLGPVVGILGQKYGIQPVIIVGGIIGTVSAAALFDINDIVWITVVWGGINGAGTALTTTLPQVVIGQHFKKYRATASGMAFSGGCIGAFLFPGLIEYFLSIYDLGGTFLLIAGFIMHVIPAAMLLRTPSWWNDKKTKRNQVLTDNNYEEEQNKQVSELYQANEARKECTEFSPENLPQTINAFAESNLDLNNIPLLHNQNSAQQQAFKCDIDSEFLWQNRDTLIKVLTNNFTLQYEQSDVKHRRSFHSDDVFVNGIELLLRKLEINSRDSSDKSEAQKGYDGPETKTNFSNGSVKHEGINDEVETISINYVEYYLEKLFKRDKNDLLKNFPEEQQESIQKILEDLQKLHSSLISYRNNSDFSLRIPCDSKFLQTGDKGEKDRDDASNSFCTHIKTAFKLYRKPLFLLICLCRTVHFMTFMPAVTIIVDYSMDKGHRLEDGKYVIVALSLGDLLGRLCLGWITDWGYVTLPKYMLSVMILSGLSTVMFPLMQTKPAIMVCMATFGLLQGSVFVRHPVLLARYLANDEQHIAMGCINLFSGVLGLLTPLYIGYFRDHLGSYNGVFYINGSIGAFIGLLWMFEPYFLKISPECVPDEDEQTEV